MALRTLVVIATCALALGENAYAHKPLFDEPDSKSLESAQEVKEPQISYAIYSNLDSPEDVDFYALKVEKPMLLYAGMLVPQTPDYEDFYPCYAVIGPGLPEPDVELPVELPEAYGALVVIPEPVKPRPKFYEPFTATRYYEGIKEIERKVKTTGTYYLIVWHPEGETGGYTAVVGKEEKWEISDMAPTIEAVRIIRKGDWMGVRSKPKKKEKGQ
ncbi:MAG TPA: hypothetical protein PL033_19630 [Candidatus Brocadiia bacterium]|nr:hypothetical protein [Candidatus Brocadiia bacterium]